MIWSSILPAFFASIVEFVEALTIVLVVGVTINWKSSIFGAITASITLALLVLIFGNALITIIPIEVLRLVVGIILVLFGMQWLKKAVLRYSGLKALHDEGKIYERERQELLSHEIVKGAFSPFGFLTAFKSVLLEGLEVVFIVIMAGLSAETTLDGIYNASMGAVLAFLLVVVFGLVLRKPLTLVPENTLKYIVGLMLVSFGIFWSGEGFNIDYPFSSDLFILIIIAFLFITTQLIILWLKQNQHLRTKVSVKLKNLIIKFLYELWDFFCGDVIFFMGFALTIVLLMSLQTQSSLLLIPVYLLGIMGSFILSLKLDLA